MRVSPAPDLSPVLRCRAAPHRSHLEGLPCHGLASRAVQHQAQNPAKVAQRLSPDLPWLSVQRLAARSVHTGGLGAPFWGALIHAMPHSTAVCTSISAGSALNRRCDPLDPQTSPHSALFTAASVHVSRVGKSGILNILDPRAHTVAAASISHKVVAGGLVRCMLQQAVESVQQFDQGLPQERTPLAAVEQVHGTDSSRGTACMVRCSWELSGV